MAAKISLRLTNRSPKQPIKKLPSAIDVSPETTVEDVKKLISQQVGIKDHNRIGLFYPSTKKTLKNRKATIVSEADVVAAGELLVKDLGVQVDWTTVFIVEYLGPILAHAAVLQFRAQIYPSSATPAPLTPTQALAGAMIVGHFVKREYETLFVHRFSANTMPARNIFKNSFFYWALAGAGAALEVYWPGSLAARAGGFDALDAVGFALFAFGEVSNALVHLNLASLRSAGGTERQVPRGYGFGLVTCPNYMFEIIAWVGIVIGSRSLSCLVFILIGTWQMYAWAAGKERAYRKEFPDTYKKKRYVILPGLL